MRYDISPERLEALRESAFFRCEQRRAPSRSGIYAIVNAVNGRAYIGSAVNIARRWNLHLWKLRSGKAQRKLQAAWNKYGESLFRFVVLDFVDAGGEQLVAREQWRIDEWGTATGHGYNIRSKAESNAGMSLSAETRARISAANLGKKYKLSAEERSRRRERFVRLHCGKKTPEERATRSAKLKGIPKPWLVGVPMPASVRAKIAQTLKGRKLSVLHRQRLSEAAKRRYRNA